MAVGEVTGCSLCNNRIGSSPDNTNGKAAGAPVGKDPMSLTLLNIAVGLVVDAVTGCWFCDRVGSSLDNADGTGAIVGKDRISLPLLDSIVGLAVVAVPGCLLADKGVGSSLTNADGRNTGALDGEPLPSLEVDSIVGMAVFEVTGRGLSPVDGGFVSSPTNADGKDRGTSVGFSMSFPLLDRNVGLVVVAVTGCSLCDIVGSSLYVVEGKETGASVGAALSVRDPTPSPLVVSKVGLKVVADTGCSLGNGEVGSSLGDADGEDTGASVGEALSVGKSTVGVMEGNEVCSLLGNAKGDIMGVSLREMLSGGG